MTSLLDTPLVRPGIGQGLKDVFRRRYLLKLLVRKEIKLRYRGSVLGVIWSYVKPAIQFVVFYIAMGVFLGLNKNVGNYAVYLFSGIVLINFFTEALNNAAKSIVYNSGLIKKIFLPRELFPVASVFVSAAHFFPQLVVLLIGCLLTGWQPTPLGIFAGFAGFLVLAMLSVGLGLFFSSVNVYFRDSENFVEMMLMVATWVSPVMYQWTMVHERLGDFWFAVYQSNPVTVGVELFHYAFWSTTSGGDAALAAPPQLFELWLPVALVVSAAVLALGQFTFRKLEVKFAQEL
ncbi:ABC transporter permease [Arthrobacter celericrescens]|uniref:ABC transporter permease n=1 Tax=Arthrobacter celericrescens TaxID=2320851 RepID=UPI000EA1A5CC|nr:ABC transporter permease [Arthrobacter celericrescens]